MSITQNAEELSRLVAAFEQEAAKFHDIKFSVFYLLEGVPVPDRRFAAQNHTIPLWQYHGAIDGQEDAQRLSKNVADRDEQWGIPNPKCAAIGVIEGEACQLFVRMAKRAGSLFSWEEALQFKLRVLAELQEWEGGAGKPTLEANDDPLAIWLNYLLYYLSRVSPIRSLSTTIEPDPFSLSLLALERLADDHALGKADRSTRKLEDLEFKVAMSFPGEKRRYVSRVVNALREPLGPDSIFYDYDYQAQLARPNLDTLLQRIYAKQSKLIVVFLCAEYAAKEWCGLEWRVVRDIIKGREDERVMFVRFDRAAVDGVLSIDGFVDGDTHTAVQLAKLVVERVKLLE